MFWQGREECLKENLQYNEVDKNKYNYFLDNGDFNTQELLL